MSPKGSRLGSALALVLSLPFAAGADDASGDAPTVELPEEVVRLPRAEAEDDPTAAASVVEADRFAGESKAVADLVATAPGVAVNGYGGLGQFATASIRGSTADGVLVLVDGLPLNAAFGGGVDLSTIPRHWVERIEVVRGAEGAHYGAGALGGVLNVVTRRPEPGRWSAEASGASFDTDAVGTYAVAVDRGFARRGLSLLAAASAERTDGAFEWERDPTQAMPDNGDEVTLVREHNASRRAGGLLKLAGAAGSLRVDALLQISGGRRELPPDPELSGGAGFQEDGRVLAMARVAGLAPRPDLTFSARAHVRLDRLDVRAVAPLSEQRGGAAGVAVEAVLAHAGGLLTATAEATGEALRAESTGDRNRGTVSVAVAEELVLAGGRVRLAPAARAERVGAFSGWSAKAGASVRVAPAVVARASAGRTFRAPGFAELYLVQGVLRPNPALAPETGTGGDVALVVDGAAGFASVGGHVTVYRDLILYDPISLDLLRPRNMGRALATGLELEAATAPARRLANLALSGSYTLLHTRNLRGEAAVLGNPLPQRARHRLYARAAVRPGRLAAHVEAHYVGRQYADAENQRPVDAVLLFGAGAGWTLPTRTPLGLALEVRNLFDDRSLRDAIGNPLPGRMVMLSVRAGATAEGTP